MTRRFPHHRAPLLMYGMLLACLGIDLFVFFGRKRSPRQEVRHEPIADPRLVVALTANGYEVFRVEPRFMPLSVKSRLPVTPFLIRAWLAAPMKPMGKQMLVRARPRR